jgi:hypothetical protein
MKARFRDQWTNLALEKVPYDNFRISYDLGHTESCIIFERSTVTYKTVWVSAGDLPCSI